MWNQGIGTPIPIGSSPIVSTGLSVEYGLSKYGTYGLTPSPYIAPEHNTSRRYIGDGKFSWDPAAALEWGLSEISDVEEDVLEDNNYLIWAETYEIAISPDIGWPITENMFNPYSPTDPFNTNTKVFLRDNLSVDLGHLTYDEEERTLSYTLTDSEIDNIFNTETQYYWWSVRGKDQYGTPSKWAPPRKFQAIFSNVYGVITVDDVSNKHERLITINGTKNAAIDSISINGDTSLSTYPSRETWIANIAVTGGLNTIYVAGIPITGNYTPYAIVNINVETGVTNVENVFNTFDDYGLMHGVDRIVSIEEDNKDYKRRIIDAFIHPGNSNLLGLHHSICRNLSLSCDDYAVVVRPAMIDAFRYSDAVYSDLTLEIATNYIYLSSQSFLQYNEYHIVSNDLKVTLNNKPLLHTTDILKVYSKPGVLLKDTEYKIDDDVLKFKEDMLHKEVWVTYPKKLSVAIGPDIDLVTMGLALIALRYDGHQIVTASLSSNLRGLDSSDNLIRGIFKLRSNARYIRDNEVYYGTPIRWSSFSIHRLTDPDFMNRYIDGNGQLLNTKIESFVNQFKKLAHHTWETVVADKDIWDPIDPVTENSARINNILDSKVGYYESTDQSINHRYTSTQAFDLGYVNSFDKTYLEYFGVPIEDLKCGVGRDQDLKVVIKDNNKQEVLTPPDVYRETINWTVEGQIDDSQYLPSTVFGGLLFRP